MHRLSDHVPDRSCREPVIPSGCVQPDGMGTTAIEEGSGNCGNCANLRKPNEMRIEHIHGSQVANLRKLRKPRGSAVNACTSSETSPTLNCSPSCSGMTGLKRLGKHIEQMTSCAAKRSAEMVSQRSVGDR